MTIFLVFDLTQSHHIAHPSLILINPRAVPRLAGEVTFMNTDATGAPTVADAKVEAVVRECQALQSSMGRNRTIRRLLLLAMLGFLIGFGLAYYNKGKHLSSDAYRQELVSLAQSHLEDQSDDYMRQIEGLVSTSSPVLTEAFYERAKQDLPHYLSALGSERDVLVKRLQDNVEKKLQETQGRMLERYEGILRAEFPDMTEEQYGRMINNLEVAVQRLAQRYYKEELQGQLNQLYDTWDSFPKTEPNADPDLRLEDQFISALVDLLQHKLTELDQPIGTTSASL